MEGQMGAAAVTDTARMTIRDLDVGGMTCAGCARRVERTLAEIPGVETAEVNLALERARVTWQGDAVSTNALVDAVNDAGYRATLRAADVAKRRQQSVERDEEEAHRLAVEARMLAVSGALTAPLLAMMVLPPLGVSYHLPAWVQLLLAMPVQFWIGARFYVGAWHALSAKSGNMDLLVAMGTTAAFALSTWIMIRDGLHTSAHLYYEASAVVITLVAAGKLLESRAKRGTTKAIRELMALRPERARVERDGTIVETPIDDVAVGDVVVVRPGERIPVDGEICDGTTDVDEALITGESVPAIKSAGDRVPGGAINGTAEIRVRANRVGEDSTLARIVRLVENAQTGKAPVQRLVDKVSAVFVPVVLVLAFVTLAGWLAAGAGVEASIINAVSVLVIACPCALGLATPTAIVAGTGAAARAGILIKDIGVLERAHMIDTAAFDKTGTLTLGTPAVSAVQAFGVNEDEMLRNAAAVQAGSEHPLAKAVLAEAARRGLEEGVARNVVAHVGSGIEGDVAGTRVILGNRQMLAANEIDLGAAEAAAETMAKDAATAVFVAYGGEVRGVIGIRDTLRPETPVAMRMLRRDSIKTLMLSGDTPSVADVVAQAAGIAEVRAGLKPDEKVDAIHRLQRQGRSVAMIGDGINDAPALATANLGIAMGSGTDVAMETAGITLMRPDPRLVAAALRAARKTWNRIRWNLFWAFIFNVVGLPLAALGYLSPAVAGAAMAMSSVTVVTSSLLLRGWRPELEEVEQ